MKSIKLKAFDDEDYEEEAPVYIVDQETYSSINQDRRAHQASHNEVLQRLGALEAVVFKQERIEALEQELAALKGDKKVGFKGGK